MNHDDPHEHAGSASLLRITSEVSELDTLRRFIEERGAALGVEQRRIYDLVLATSELVTNIMVHGYRGTGGIIDVEIRRAGDVVEVRLRDEAPPFDPTTVPAPDTTLPLELRPVGGLGIHMARHFVDTMTHRLRAGGGNELVLTRRRQ